MPRPIHFDLSADNPERAMGFYKEVFGWKFEKWNGPMEYWMVTTGDEKEPGINGGLTRKGESGMPNMNTVSVSSVDEFSKKITDKGWKVIDAKNGNT